MIYKCWLENNSESCLRDIVVAKSPKAAAIAFVRQQGCWYEFMEDAAVVCIGTDSRTGVRRYSVLVKQITRYFAEQLVSIC